MQLRVGAPLAVTALLVACESGAPSFLPTPEGFQFAESAAAGSSQFSQGPFAQRFPTPEEEEAAWASQPFDWIAYESQGDSWGASPVFRIELHRGGRVVVDKRGRVEFAGVWETELALYYYALLCSNAEAIGVRELPPEYQGIRDDDRRVVFEFASPEGLIRIADDGGAAPPFLEAYRLQLEDLMELFPWGPYRPWVGPLPSQDWAPTATE